MVIRFDEEPEDIGLLRQAARVEDEVLAEAGEQPLFTPALKHLVERIAMYREQAFCGREGLNLSGFAYRTCTLPVGHEGECRQGSLGEVLQRIRDARAALHLEEPR